jgi:hypothetical protein
MKPQERNQRAFDRAVTGVILQGRPSVNSRGDCRLRGKDGLKCAIGHLIQDDTRARTLDRACGGSIHGLLLRGEVHEDLHVDLLRELQQAHDCDKRSENFVRAFADQARVIAHRHGVNHAAIDVALAQRGAA